jgi:hypothetical protein
MQRAHVAVALLVALVVVGCDSTPGDPLDPRTDITALLHGGPAAGQLPGLSLPGLVYSAVHKVYSEQGAAATRVLVTDLRRLEEQGRGARQIADRETATARLRAIRDEELRIVLRVFGEAIVLRIIDAVVSDAGAVERSIAETESSGRLLPRAREHLAQLDAWLAEAAAAAERRDAFAALDAATQAAASADAARHTLAGVRRIAGIDELFEQAAARLQDRNGPEATRAELATFNRRRRDADEVVRTGDRDAAYNALRSLRDEQVRIVLIALGPESVPPLLGQIETGIAELDIALARALASGRDVTRLDRMSAAARDLLQRAMTSMQAGDAAAALDLGSHAAGLVNAARGALSF